MTFGLMVKKWGILSRPLNMSMNYVKSLIMSIACLHKYSIDKHLDMVNNIQMNQTNVKFGISERWLEDDSSDIKFMAMSDKYPGCSLNWNCMVCNICAMKMIRPRKQHWPDNV